MRKLAIVNAEDWESLLQKDLAELSGVHFRHAGGTSRLRKGERRNVAVLFLDLKDFTSLSEKLDHETVHNLLSGIMKALTNVVDGFGGYVDKIHGDQIMALFGARHAGENDSIQAVSCGFRMLETVESVNALLSGTGLEFGVRIGIGAGPVIVAPDAVGHITAIGSTVNLASRMESSARTNTIQVTEKVRLDCGDYFTWDDLGQIPIKGISAPSPVFRPTGPGNTLVTRWDRASTITGAPFVGRQVELGILEEVLQKQNSLAAGFNRRKGARHIVVGIRGEGGIGKSRLIHHFLNDLLKKRPDTVVMSGQALPWAQPPFQLWSSLIAANLGIRGGEILEFDELQRRITVFAEGSEYGDSLLSSLPFLGELLGISGSEHPLEDIDDKSRRQEILLAVRNFIRVAASGGNTLVLLENVHWIDRASLETLEFVVTNCDLPAPILFISLFRPVDVSPLEGLSKSYAEVTTVDLHQVDEKDSRELIHHMLGPEVEEQTMALLIDRARGNPFFLEELVIMLIESGNLVRQGNRWVQCCPSSDLLIPASIEGLVKSRIDRLTPELRRGILYCSVLGMEFPESLYTRMVEKTLAPISPGAVLEKLVFRGFLTRSEKKGDSFTFRQPMIHDAAYDSLLHHNRRMLHRFAAESLEELHSSGTGRVSGVLSRHWERAGDTEKAVLVGLEALKMFRNSYQSEEGVRWADHLFSLIGDNPDDVFPPEKLLEVLDCKAFMLDVLDRREEERLTLERMLELGSGIDSWHARILWRTGNLQKVLCNWGEAAELCEKALEIYIDLSDLQGVGWSRNSLGVLSWKLGDSAAARSHFEEALEIAESMEKADFEGSIHCNSGILDKVEGKTASAETHYLKALDFFRRIGNRRDEASVLCNLGILHHVEERTIESERCYRSALKIYRDIGDRRREGVVLGNLGTLLAVTGQKDDASSCLDQALTLHLESGDRISEARERNNLGILLQETGHPHKALVHLERAAYLNGEIENTNDQIISLAVLGKAHLDLDEAGQAMDYYDSARLLQEDYASDGTGAETLVELIGMLREKGLIFEDSQ